MNQHFSEDCGFEGLMPGGPEFWCSKGRKVAAAQALGKQLRGGSTEANATWTIQKPEVDRIGIKDLEYSGITIMGGIFMGILYRYPPTPAFAKAGAAPGTTAGVELVFLSNRHPKATSMTFYGRPAQAIATRRPDPSLLLGGPACRSPGIRSQQASQGHINGFLWASKLFLGGPACRSPGIRSQQTSQGHINGFLWASKLFLGGPACRSPGIRSQQASQGHINGFLWASKLAVCQPLNP